MLFIEWWLVKRFSVGLLMIAVAFIIWWFARRKGWPIRLPAHLISGLVVLYGFLVMWWVVASSHIYSVPIYSPNQKMAVRIDACNPGELGGPTYDSVELFWAHGFISAVVFSGECSLEKRFRTGNLLWRNGACLHEYSSGKSPLH
jgi:hypothetical protein